LRKLFNFPQIWSNGVTISWSFILFFNKAKGLFQKPVKRFLILNAGNDLSKRSFVSWNQHYLEACIRNFNEFLRWKSPKRIRKEIPPSNSLLQKKILSLIVVNCLHWQLSSTSMMWGIQILKYWFVCHDRRIYNWMICQKGARRFQPYFFLFAFPMAAACKS